MRCWSDCKCCKDQQRPHQKLCPRCVQWRQENMSSTDKKFSKDFHLFQISKGQMTAFTVWRVLFAWTPWWGVTVDWGLGFVLNAAFNFFIFPNQQRINNNYDKFFITLFYCIRQTFWMYFSFCPVSYFLQSKDKWVYTLELFVSNTMVHHSK